MRVLATGTCDTLSGSSQLTYHIGCMPDGEIYLRVIGNTGGGFFSREWISLRDILRTLEKRPGGKPITSILLNDLFRGKSVKTPALLLAVLLHEKLIRSLQGKLRRHELADASVFTEKVEKLMSSGTGAKSKTARTAKTAGSTTKKAPIKNKSTTPKRKKPATDRST